MCIGSESATGVCHHDIRVDIAGSHLRCVAQAYCGRRAGSQSGLGGSHLLAIDIQFCCGRLLLAHYLAHCHRCCVLSKLVAGGRDVFFLYHSVMLRQVELEAIEIVDIDVTSRQAYVVIAVFWRHKLVCARLCHVAGLGPCHTVVRPFHLQRISILSIDDIKLEHISGFGCQSRCDECVVIAAARVSMVHTSLLVPFARYCPSVVHPSCRYAVAALEVLLPHIRVGGHGIGRYHHVGRRAGGGVQGDVGCLVAIIGVEHQCDAECGALASGEGDICRRHGERLGVG